VRRVHSGLVARPRLYTQAANGSDQGKHGVARLPDHEVRRFLTSPALGTVDFGILPDHIARAIGHRAGPIRLQWGIPGPKGFGNSHVEGYPDRVKQITRLGFRTFASFAAKVATNYTKVLDGGYPDKLSLVLRDQGHDLQIIIRDNGAFWGITTGLPYRVARGKVLWEVSRTGGSEPTPEPLEGPPLRDRSITSVATGEGS
jgi:hypothetical protein